MSERPTAERLAEIERRASDPVAYVTQDRQAMLDLLAEIDALRAERDEGYVWGEDSLCKRTVERDNEAARAKRAEAQLAALHEAATDTCEAAGELYDDRDPDNLSLYELRAALANTAAAAAEHDARVRREALEEAASRTGEAIKGPIGWVGITDGQEQERDEARAEANTEANRIAEAVEDAIESCGVEVPDGSGCDSGDVADFVAAQVTLALSRQIDAADEATEARSRAEHDRDAEKARADRAERERDEARTQLAALREAAVIAARPGRDADAVRALDAALADPSAAAAEHDARVRREALEEAERECAGAEYAEQCEARIRGLATKERP